MRVFIGTSNIANAAMGLQQGFRDLGCAADVGLLSSNKYYSTENSIHIDSIPEGTQYAIDDNGDIRAVPGRGFYTFVERYDIFVFIASSTFLPAMLDLPVLKQLGKKIICFQTGSELRDPHISMAMWAAYGHKYPMDMPQKKQKKHFFELQAFDQDITKKLHNTRMAETYGDVICAHPGIFSLGLRPYFNIQMPLPLSRDLENIPGRRRPLVVHAPTSRQYKGTGLVLEAFKTLQAEGVPFDFILLENLSNAEVRDKLREADILVDQVGCGGLGMLALEGLASGCMVLSGNSGIVPYPPDKPAISVTPSSLLERLRSAICDPARRHAYAESGHKWVEKYHTPAVIVQNLLENFKREEAGDWDYFPTAYADMCPRRPGYPVPSPVRRMTFDLLKKYGLHPDCDPLKLYSVGALPKDSKHLLKGLHKWSKTVIKRNGPWNWCSKRLPEPEFDPDSHTWLTEQEALKHVDPDRKVFDRTAALSRVIDSFVELWQERRLSKRWRQSVAGRADIFYE